jgi:hypothetical protein
LISVSQWLAPYIDRAFILSPKDSEGDHSIIGIDFDFGALTLYGNLSEIDPGHAENRNLVSTDVKASTAFLKIIKKENSAHNATSRMHTVFERCNRTGRCTDNDWRQYQDLSNLLYSHVNQTEKECKEVGAHAWSRMLAAVGRTVQYANEEFQTRRDQRICICMSQTKSSRHLCSSPPNPGSITRTTRNWSPTNDRRTS